MRAGHSITAKPPENEGNRRLCLSTSNDAEHLWGMAASSGLSNRSCNRFVSPVYKEAVGPTLQSYTGASSYLDPNQSSLFHCYMTAEHFVVIGIPLLYGWWVLSCSGLESDG